MKNMGDGRRVAKAEKEVQQLVAQFLLKGFKHPLPGLVTVSRVKMPGDLRTARVYVTVMGEKGSLEQALEILQENSREFQTYVGKNLPMRYTPVISFYADEATEHMLKMERIFHELEAERQLKNPPIAGDADPEADSDDSENNEE